VPEGSSSFLRRYQQMSYISQSCLTHNLKKRRRFALEGIWKPHCQPFAILRNSVGTFGLLLKPFAEGHFEMTCCTSGYNTSISFVRTRIQRVIVIFVYLGRLGPSDAGIGCTEVDRHHDPSLGPHGLAYGIRYSTRMLRVAK
jgi:hypothetical protein